MLNVVEGLSGFFCCKLLIINMIYIYYFFKLSTNTFL